MGGKSHSSSYINTVAVERFPGWKLETCLNHQKHQQVMCQRFQDPVPYNIAEVGVILHVIKPERKTGPLTLTHTPFFLRQRSFAAGGLWQRRCCVWWAAGCKQQFRKRTPTNRYTRLYPNGIVIPEQSLRLLYTIACSHPTQATVACELPGVYYLLFFLFTVRMQISTTQLLVRTRATVSPFGHSLTPHTRRPTPSFLWLSNAN